MRVDVRARSLVDRTRARGYLMELIIWHMHKARSTYLTRSKDLRMLWII